MGTYPAKDCITTIIQEIDGNWFVDIALNGFSHGYERIGPIPSYDMALEVASDKRRSFEAFVEEVKADMMENLRRLATTAPPAGSIS